MKRKSFEHDACPLARSLEAVGDAWSVLIVREAFAGRRRFGAFEQALGIAKSILTVRLRKPVAPGVLEQVPAGTHHEYVLTEKGRGVFPVPLAIRHWGDGCGAGEPYRLVDRRDGKPVRPLAFVAHDGRELGPDEVELVPEAEVRRAVRAGR